MKLTQFQIGLGTNGLGEIKIISNMIERETEVKHYEQYQGFASLKIFYLLSLSSDMHFTWQVL